MDRRTAVLAGAPSGTVSALALVVSLAAAFGAAGLGSIATTQNVEGWYSQAEKAAWNPPNWVFAPVWTILYALMAIAAWLIWRHYATRDGRDREVARTALVLYVVQLALNAAWTPAFFGLYPVIGVAALWIALAIIGLLDIVLPVTVRAFWRVDRTAAALLVPYLLWILFATTLNAAVAILNA